MSSLIKRQYSIVIENGLEPGEHLLASASTTCDHSDAKLTATVTKCTNRLQCYRLLPLKKMSDNEKTAESPKRDYSSIEIEIAQPSTSTGRGGWRDRMRQRRVVV